MSTTTSYTSTSRTSVASGGIPSKVILLLAALAAVLISVIDINWHGHFSCKTLGATVLAELQKRTHLAAYMADVHTDKSGKDVPQPKNAVVTCTCNQFGKIVLSGKVDNPLVRQEFSDVAALAIGIDKVDNQLEVLHEPSLAALKNLLAPQVNMDYRIGDLGTVYLTGSDLPDDPTLKDRISEMVARIPGVRTVVNDIGKELRVPAFLRMHNIWFDFNQWKIRPQSQPALSEAAQAIQEYLARSPAGTVRVEGHTDTIASDKYNQWLSEKRANAVLEALVSMGIPRDKLRALGRGEADLLIAPDDTPEKRAENRRIEFHFE